MHRSGTSAVAGLLRLLGVDLGANLMKPANDNPKGFWEHYEIVGCQVSLLEALNSYVDDILPLADGWEQRPETRTHSQYLKNLIFKEFSGKPLWGFKDPRTCRLLPLWHSLLEELNCDARFVIVVRNPDEIAQSLTARGGHSYNQALLVMLEHMLAAERNTRGRSRIVVSYDHLMANWRLQADRMGVTLGIRWPNSNDSIAAQAAEFLDPGQRHHFSQSAGTPESAIAIRGANPQIAHWAFLAYQMFLAAANDAAPLNETGADRIAADLRAATQFLAAWRPPRTIKDRITKIHMLASHLDDEVKRLTKENEELRNRLPK
jgi:hypothetical protein